MLLTDKTSYVAITEGVESRMTEKSSKDSTENPLKWVHLFISNAKHSLQGNDHHTVLTLK